MFSVLPVLWLAAALLRAAESQGTTPLQRELSALQEQLKQAQEQNRQMMLRLQALQKRVDELEQSRTGPPPASPPAPAQPPGRELSMDDIFKEVGVKPPAPAAPAPSTVPSIAPEAAQPQTSDQITQSVGQYEGAKLPWFRALSNPSIGVVADVLAGFSDEAEAYDRRDRIDLRELELVAYGSIDPFAQLSGLISGAHDVSVEEGALTLTALPADLQLRGGKFFANVSRLNKTHTHDLPFVEQPLTMQNFLGSVEPMDGHAWWSAEPQFNTMGAELSWMVPTPFYWQWQLSAYNEFSDRSPGSFWEQYVGGPGVERSHRGLRDFTFHLGTKTFLELSPDHSLRLFANALIDAPTSDMRRLTESGGITYLWLPLDRGLYKRFEWTTEAFANQERFLHRIEDQHSWGLYSYIKQQWGRKFEGGLLGEWSAFRFDDAAGAWHAGAWLTYHLSERHLFRFQIDRFGIQDWLDSIALRTGFPAGDGDHWLFSIQWSAVLGSHEHTYE